MVSQVRFVSGASFERTGVAGHVSDKVRRLEELGFVVERETIGSLSRDGWRSIVALLRSVKRSILGTAVYYAKAGLPTILVALPVAYRNKPVIFEINGFLRPRGAGGAPQRTLAIRLLRHLGRRRSVVFVGDPSWMEYIVDEWRIPRSRVVNLPLWIGAASHVSTHQSLRPVVTYAGSDQPWQGLDWLIGAWKVINPIGWTLELIGPPSLDRFTNAQARVAWVGEFDSLSDTYKRRVNSSHVLASAYPTTAMENYRLSALKTVEYARTPGRVVLHERDTVLDGYLPCDYEALGLYPYDGMTRDGLERALRDAIRASASHVRPQIERRWTMLEAARGPAHQHRALRTAFAMSGASLPMETS